MTKRTGLLPDTIAARIALTLILGLFAAQTVSWLAFIVERPDARPPLRPWELARHITAAVELMETLPTQLRAKGAADFDGPYFALRWSADTPDMPADSGHFPYERFRRDLQRDLGGDHPILVDADPPSFFRFLGLEPEPPRGGRHRPGPLRIAIGLDGGGWLLVTGIDPHQQAWLVRLAIWSGLIATLIIGLSWWAARRITAPLARFAAAAEHLGLDAAAPPLPEAGPTEIRAATHAVNRMQDRLRRFVEDRTRMVAAIGHDLKTPITRLRLRAEFVEDPEQQKKLLADLEEMEAMIAATLAFARDDAQKEPRVSVDLADLLQSLCEAHADAGGDATYAGPTRFPYLCRPVAMRRAIGNLIDNAIKYGERARVSLTKTGDQVVLAIEDDGPGIPEPDQERVFAPFYRLEASRNRDTGGTGLGLSVARTIVRGHGGDILLSNTPEGGLRATVTLPG